jgi:sec-independent protein translocase protein TatB
MPQIGWLEIISVVIIAILVLGPKEFPVALKKIGSYIGKIKNTLSNFKREVSSVTNEIDINDISDQEDVKKENKKSDEL